jgi:hypothetical protein
MKSDSRRLRFLAIAPAIISRPVLLLPLLGLFAATALLTLAGLVFL